MTPNDDDKLPGGMTPPSKDVARLVARFTDNIRDYLNPGYNEEQTRADFLAPLFEALGWDVSNKAGTSQKYRDVLHEASLKIGSTHKAPDYSFRIEGQRRFFVEAKKPSVDIRKDAAAAYQLRSYGWSAGLSLSVLSNFRTFCVYDCRYEPRASDGAAVALVLCLDYSDFPKRWAEVAVLFARPAVGGGSLERYAEEVKAARGVRRVDEAFLSEIESWRRALASNIKQHNPNITVADLNFAVQATIDRIIFLRMCEDRGIEPYGQLQRLAEGTRLYEGLVRLYLQSDARYNSGLFHFKEEKGRAETPDPITPNLVVMDAPLRKIIGRIYFPASPYAFRYLDPHILGQVYEQFLGKIITLHGGRADVEEKPEVKKAGGVYYTPSHIVSYIVEQTIGAFLKGKRPGNPLRGFRIVDAACGSGSFLLGAYHYLLEWYCDRYVEDLPTRTSRRLFKDAAGEWRLTIDERKRILLAHIYGVDIDLQAVEVTKLSLLLSVLEGENAQTLQQQLQMFHARALPDLGNNIKCGNSIISDDYYSDEQLALFPVKRPVNTFD
jgi:predicted type IV restriction endonuclease